MTWLRLYDDTVDNDKLHYIAELTGKSVLEIFGAWIAVLCLASRSPKRGKLLIIDGVPRSVGNVSETFHVTVTETQVLLDAFIRAGLLSLTDGRYEVVNWDSKQFTSDLSTERVRKYRKAQRFGNVSETDQRQSTETEYRDRVQSTEREREKDTPTPAADAVSAYQQYISSTGMTVTLLDALKQSCLDYGEKAVIGAIKEAHRSGKRSWAYCNGILRSADSEGRLDELAGIAPKISREVKSIGKALADRW